MIARRALAVAVILVVMAPPALAARPEGSVVECRRRRAYSEMDGRRYRGPLAGHRRVRGTAVVEVTSLDAYLEGIREVPFSWHEDALAAQVVAARTYLAWTLQGGRTETGSRIGTILRNRGVPGLCRRRRSAGRGWRSLAPGRAPDFGRDPRPSGGAGARFLLVDHGSPDQEHRGHLARVRAGAVPGRRASPGEDSPFVEWSWELPGYQMEQLLREAEVADGDVRSITARTTEDGQGPWMIDIVSDSGTVSMDTWALRSRLNEAAAILPGLLPAKRPDGIDYPTTVLSPEYSIR